MPVRRVQARPTTVRQSVAVRSLHWLSAVALLVAAASVVTREWVEAEALRTLLMTLHRQAGMLVLLGLVLRLILRFQAGLVDHSAELPKALRMAAFAGHLGLYALLLALPLLGWAACNAHNQTVTLLGLVPLPQLVAANADLADTLGDCHSWAAWVMLALAIAHVGAALWHHFVRKDQVLVAMLPTLESASPSAAQGRRQARQGTR
jgi:cytochrome b561